MKRLSNFWLWLLVVASVTGAAADIALWQLGGSGFSWADSDSAQVMIDFTGPHNSIQPVLVSSDTTVFPLLENWSPKIGF